MTDKKIPILGTRYDIRAVDRGTDGLDEYVVIGDIDTGAGASVKAKALLVRPSYTWLDIARGYQNTVHVVKKFGVHATVSTNFEAITTSGAYPTPSSPVSLEFVSDNIGDALNSTGMHEITVVGIDANWNEQTVVTAAHATNGTVPVAISGTWLRVHRAYVSKSGNYASITTGGSHLGTITIRVAGAGASWGTISVSGGFGLGQTLIGCYTIPTGYTGYVFPTNIGVDAGKTADVAFFTRENADDITSSYSGTMRSMSFITGINGGTPFNVTGSDTPYGPIVGHADLGYLAKVTTGTNNVSVEFDIYLTPTV